ncbi:MAG: SDR family oxidoreductase, partial [Lentisphaeria bacterium]|nr:SDR family oxidoreductase [Lentisphaeria bacterium]
MSVSNSEVLVTGGAGFIGSHLVDALLKNSNRVICLDNFSTGRRENLADALKKNSFRLVEGDIRDRSVCREVMKGVKVVFHEAALGSVPRSIADPAESTSVNVAGFVNILHAAVEAEVESFVYASSSSVYGDEEKLPKQEERIGTALSPYAVTKYADELFAANFAAVYGLKITGLRYFNVFGPRQDPKGAYAAVIPRFVTALLRNESPVIFGDGTNSRDFTYVANVVSANMLAAARKTDGHRVYNVAAGGRTDLNELFALLKNDLLEKGVPCGGVDVKYAPCRAGDIPHSFADISRAEEELGYRVLFSIKEGIREMTGYY